jgi:hypothetical protein
MLNKKGSFQLINISIIKIIIITFLFSSVIVTKADDEKYLKAMEQNIGMIDTASSLESLINIANRFERIAVTEKDKWLPYYYAAYHLAISCFVDTVKEMKDSYLDRAEHFIEIADSLQPDNSEILTIKGLLAQGRLVVDPQNRWQKYGSLASTYLSKAKELDPGNPRPDFLNGQSVLYTPEQFGGGKERALPILKEAEKKFKSFEPETPIHPKWGEKQLMDILASMQE